MSRSATPATRNEATRRLKPPKMTTSAELTWTYHRHGERLRTVADANATSSEHTLNPQTPRVKREPLLRIREKGHQEGTYLQEAAENNCPLSWQWMDDMWVSICMHFRSHSAKPVHINWEITDESVFSRSSGKCWNTPAPHSDAFTGAGLMQVSNWQNPEKMWHLQNRPPQALVNHSSAYSSVSSGSFTHKAFARPRRIHSQHLDQGNLTPCSFKAEDFEFHPA